MTRTLMKSVVFAHPFKIGDLEDELPPGSYVVEEDEEQIPGISRTAFRRVRTIIQLPAGASKRRDVRTLTITPEQLQAALDRDLETSDREKHGEPLGTTVRVTNAGKLRTRTLTGDMLMYGITSSLSETFFVDGYRYSNLDDAVAQAKRTAANEQA